jgi:carboxylesterase
MTAPIIPGAEPASYPGGPNGVLVLHGFTGNPQSMRPLAEAVAAAGHAVELPLLPGHGTAIEDLIPTTWADWSATAEATYLDLARRCDRVAVSGLSMGGTLATWLAARHPEVAALVTINGAVEPGGTALLDMGRQLLAEGTETLPAVGSDIADPAVKEDAYEATPVAPLMSLVQATEDLAPLIPGIHCPALVFTSVQDHVVPPSAGEYLAAHLGGPVERVLLERSYHVATLDYDAAEIQARTVEFLAKVMAG